MRIKKPPVTMILILIFHILLFVATMIGTLILFRLPTDILRQWVEGYHWLGLLAYLFYSSAYLMLFLPAIVIAGVTIIFTPIWAILFFRHKRSFRILYTVMAVIQILALAAFCFLFGGSSAFFWLCVLCGGLAILILASIFYVFFSKRVKRYLLRSNFAGDLI